MWKQSSEGVLKSIWSKNLRITIEVILFAKKDVGCHWLAMS